MAQQSPYNADGTIRNRPPAPKPKLPQPYGASGAPREETAQRRRFEQLQARVESLRAEGKTGLAEQVEANIEQQFPDLTEQAVPESSQSDRADSPPQPESASEGDRNPSPLGAALPAGSEGREPRGQMAAPAEPDRADSERETDGLLQDLQNRLDRIEKLQRKLIQMQPAESKDVNRPVFS